MASAQVRRGGPRGDRTHNPRIKRSTDHADPGVHVRRRLHEPSHQTLQRRGTPAVRTTFGSTPTVLGSYSVSTGSDDAVAANANHVSCGAGAATDVGQAGGPVAAARPRPLSVSAVRHRRVNEWRP